MSELNMVAVLVTEPDDATPAGRDFDLQVFRTIDDAKLRAWQRFWGDDPGKYDPIEWEDETLADEIVVGSTARYEDQMLRIMTTIVEPAPRTGGKPPMSDETVQVVTCQCGGHVAVRVFDGKVTQITYPGLYVDADFPSTVRKLRAPVPVESCFVTNWCPLCEQSEEAEEEELSRVLIF